MTTMTAKPASQKQFDFIKRLLAEKAVDANTLERVQVAREAAMAGHLTTRGASDLITDLLALPKAAAKVTEPTESGQSYEAGVYEQPLTGNLFRVYLGQKSGTLLVKQIVTTDGTVSYDYRGAAGRVFSTMIVRRLSLAEVGALGKTFDHCLMCGRRLDVPESVDRGIGPVCAAKYDVADVAEEDLEIDYTLAIQQREREDDERAYASKPDNQCTPGQEPCGAWNTCTDHQMAYQGRWGRADNE